MSDVRALRELAEQRYDDFVDALREMVNVDCGSYTPEGVNAIADLCQARFERGGGPSSGCGTNPPATRSSSATS